MKLVATVFLYVQLVSLGFAAKAEDGGSSNKLFDDSFKAYMASNCAGAADGFYKVTQTESGDLQNRAYLYLAHCQSVLGVDSYAAYNIQRVKPKELKGADRKLYSQLNKSLAPQIKASKEAVKATDSLGIYIAPYYGTVSISPDSSKKGGSFYGLGLTYAKDIWNLGLSYEALTLDLNTTATEKPYTQNQVHANVGAVIAKMVGVTAAYTSISSNTDAYDQATVMGAAFDLYIDMFRPFVEVYQSNYPSFSSSLTVLNKYESVGSTEFVAGLGFPLYNTAGWGLNGQALYASMSYSLPDETLYYVDESVKDSHARTEVLAALWVNRFTLTLTGWFGEEALGVRDRGATVYSGAEVRTGGQSGGLSYRIMDLSSVAVKYSQEKYETINSTTKAKSSFTSNAFVLSGSVGI